VSSTVIVDTPETVGRSTLAVPGSILFLQPPKEIKSIPKMRTVIFFILFLQKGLSWYVQLLGFQFLSQTLIREPLDVLQVQGRAGLVMVSHAGRAMTPKMGCSRRPRSTPQGGIKAFSMLLGESKIGQCLSCII
jgi:hypothetical protein